MIKLYIKCVIINIRIKGDYMDSVKIYVNNQEYTVNKNSTILDFINNNTDKFKDIIISKVDLEYTELTYKIKGNERIELFDLHEKKLIVYI